MTVRDILIYPDPGLSEKSAVVEKFDDDLATLANDMAETMYAFEGIGLAAAQIGVLTRVVVMDTQEGLNLQVFINPEIVTASDSKHLVVEGCLSLPGVHEKVSRSLVAQVSYQDLSGETVVKVFRGLEAQCIQHEVEHLDGVVLVDNIGRAKKRWITKNLKKRKNKRNLRYTAAQ